MADYETSTQRRLWTFTKEALVKDRKDPVFYSNVRLYFFEQSLAFSSRLSLRQRVVSTAQVYFSRMLTKLEVTEMNPYLLMATVLYVASRAEEQPVHIRTVCIEARHMWPDYMPVEAWQLAECEFYVSAELDACSVVHHPYEPLLRSSRSLNLVSAELQACWAVVNDTYATDVPSIYSPSVIAYTAIYMVLVLKPGLIPHRFAKQVKQRLDSLSTILGYDADLDLRCLVGCVQELLSLYALKAKFNSSEVAEKLRQMS